MEDYPGLYDGPDVTTKVYIRGEGSVMRAAEIGRYVLKIEMGLKAKEHK